MKDIYWAEKHLIKAIPKLQKAATSEELKYAFDDHLESTKSHVERFEEVFDLPGIKPIAKKYKAIEGITRKAITIIEVTEKGTLTRDAGLLIAAQKVDHHEISTYGGLAKLARALGKDGVANLVEEVSRRKRKQTSFWLQLQNAS